MAMTKSELYSIYEKDNNTEPKTITEYVTKTAKVSNRDLTSLDALRPDEKYRLIKELITQDIFFQISDGGVGDYYTYSLTAIDMPADVTSKQVLENHIKFMSDRAIFEYVDEEYLEENPKWFL